MTAENRSDLNPRLISNPRLGGVKKMKGTTHNGSHFANKGTSRSEGESMFSVGNLVAFSYYHYCSPDGRSRSRGLCPTMGDYLLQEEITLKEYNNTTSNQYGSGNYDIRKIVELSDVFWHKYSTQIRYKTFLLQILESDKNVFTDGFIAGDIAEVRNHQGKFLHIYEIPEGYRECKAVTFDATVKAINLQKKQEDDLEAKKVASRYRGIDLVFGITTRGGYYASSASFGQYTYQVAHEYDSSGRAHYKMKIMPCVPNGYYQFYLGSTPMSLNVTDGEPSIDTMTDTHWANSQSWRYSEITEVNIKKGWIFVDGQDVYEATKKTVDEMQAEKRTARKEKFENISETVTEKYGEEILKLATKKKGQVLATLSVLANSQSDVSEADVKRILKIGGDSATIGNLLAIVAAGVNPYKAAKVAEKAYAWAYLNNAFPSVEFTGYFDDAKEALEIYSKCYSHNHKNKPARNMLGGFFQENGIIL